jgi:hypothetical protein
LAQVVLVQLLLLLEVMGQILYSVQLLQLAVAVLVVTQAAIPQVVVQVVAQPMVLQQVVETLLAHRHHKVITAVLWQAADLPQQVVAVQVLLVQMVLQ